MGTGAKYIISGGVAIGSVVLVLLHLNSNPFLHFRLKSFAESVKFALHLTVNFQACFDLPLSSDGVFNFSLDLLLF